MGDGVRGWRTGGGAGDKEGGAGGGGVREGGDQRRNCEEGRDGDWRLDTTVSDRDLLPPLPVPRPTSLHDHPGRGVLSAPGGTRNPLGGVSPS